MNPRTYILPLLLLLLVSTSAWSQKEFNVWYFGYRAGIDFNSGSPVALTNGQMSTYEGVASILDPLTGAFLFCTDGVSVWDRNQRVMPNGTGLLGSNSSTQSALIVPMPWSLFFTR